jgi:hypothetical protein
MLVTTRRVNSRIKCRAYQYEAQEAGCPEAEVLGLDPRVTTSMQCRNDIPEFELWVLSYSRTVSPKESCRPMSGSTVNFDTVRSIGVALPGVEESTAYRLPTLKIKVRGKILACILAHRSAEPHSCVVLVDFDESARLLAADSLSWQRLPNFSKCSAIISVHRGTTAL